MIRVVSDSEDRSISIKTGVELVSLLSNRDESTPVGSSLMVKIKNYLSLYISHSVIYINGVNVLPHRFETLPTLCEFFELQDYELLIFIYNLLLEERKREMSLVEYLEDFSKTSFCNYFWSGIKKHGLNSYAITGIEGYENISLSYIQLLFLHYMEREEKIFFRDLIFSNFKFIGSFIDQKVIKKIENQENSEKVNAILRKRGTTSGTDYGIITQEDLVSQLIATKSGHLDEHDMIIRQEERANYEIWKRDYLARVDSYNKSRGNLNEVSLSEKELVEEYLKIFGHSSWLLDEIST